MKSGRDDDSTGEYAGGVRVTNADDGIGSSTGDSSEWSSAEEEREADYGNSPLIVVE